jgi:3-isopropylmalate dehydrogenase
MVESAPERHEPGCAGFLPQHTSAKSAEGSIGRGRKVIGILPGEGIGPEVIRAALQVVAALQPATGINLDIRRGGRIGREAEARCGRALSEEVAAFCGQVFADGGAILSGPGGGRFVYELRRHFDLFCKLNPLKPCPELLRAGRLRARHTRGVDILIVRDNSGGIYQGRWHQSHSPTEGAVAEHTFWYTEAQVRRVVEVGARAALKRRRHMTVVVKDEGIPDISGLWREVASEVARRYDVGCSFLNVDLAAYRLLQHAAEFDVLVTPNLFGDILADLGAVLLGSRGLSFGASFAADGRAVYQTNHGSAHDLAGTDRANPVGQIYSLAMLLRESFGFCRQARWIEEAVARVWRQGWRPADLAMPGCRLAGTQELAERIAAEVARSDEGGAAS